MENENSISDLDLARKRRLVHFFYNQPLSIEELIPLLKLLPNDAKLTKCFNDDLYNRFALRFWSSKFDLVVEGCEIPHIVFKKNDEGQIEVFVNDWGEKGWTLKTPGWAKNEIS